MLWCDADGVGGRRRRDGEEPRVLLVGNLATLLQPDLHRGRLELPAGGKSAFAVLKFLRFWLGAVGHSRSLDWRLRPQLSQLLQRARHRNSRMERKEESCFD